MRQIAVNESIMAKNVNGERKNSERKKSSCNILEMFFNYYLASTYFVFLTVLDNFLPTKQAQLEYACSHILLKHISARSIKQSENLQRVLFTVYCNPYHSSVMIENIIRK